ncbi:MAG TPA: HAD-IIA family hydrolase [Chloroflexota bacterium]|nr:HAD-IIA family hydrolase [Chloroflexota bacterium]
MEFRDLKAALLDLDGVMYRGNQLCHGAAELVAFLREQELRPFFLSNNSRSGPEVVAQKLTSLGVPTSANEVITAAELLVDDRARHQPKGRLAAIASDWICEQLTAAGWEVVDDGPADCLVVGLDHDLTYAKLQAALNALLSGAEFIAVNHDRVNPIQHTLEPGCGAIAAALSNACGRPSRCIGKPSQEMLRRALTRLGLDAAQAVMVGDSLDSDMPMARAGGAHSTLVLSGQTSRGDVDRLPDSELPELVLEDVAELHQRWQAALQH